jgi:type IV pilus assembly protein PilB
MDGAPRHGRPFPGLEPQREIDCRIMTRKLLGQILVEQGVVTEDTVNKALTYQKGKKMRVGEALIALGSCDEEAVTKALATQARLPYVDLRKGKISEEFTRLATREAVEQHRFIPLLEKAGKLVIAIDDPLRVFELDNLGFILNRDLAPALASPTSLRAKMREVYGIGEENTVAKLVGGNADSESEDAPIIRMVQKMIETALQERASDIHVEPFADRIRVRFRIDGVLVERATHPPHLQGPLLSRLKIMAGMDIAEKRKPQDGRIDFGPGLGPRSTSARRSCPAITARRWSCVCSTNSAAWSRSKSSGSIRAITRASSRSSGDRTASSSSRVRRAPARPRRSTHR